MSRWPRVDPRPITRLLMVLLTLGPVTAAVGAATATASAPDPDPDPDPADLTAQLEATVAGYHDRGAFDGGVLVLRDGRVALARGFGLADRTAATPITADTRFPIASVTKQFTAVMVLQLVDEGSVNLDATVTRHLPWYRADTGDRITVRQLLLHMSGLPEGIRTSDDVRDAVPLIGSARRMVERFALGDPDFDPGTAFNYSNSDFLVLGAIIEEADGRPFAESLAARITGPLGMTDTGLLRPGTPVDGLTRGYRAERVDGITTITEPQFFGAVGHAAAGMYASVRDMGRWTQALLRHEVLSPERTAEMFTPVMLEGNVGSYVSLGSWVYPRRLGPDDPRAPRLVERRGFVPPFTALTVLCPDDGHAIVLFSNTDPCDIHQLPYAEGLPLDLLRLVYGPAAPTPTTETPTPPPASP